MSRLTKYFADRDEYGHNSCHGGCESCTGVLCGDAFEMIKKLAHYEDLEEQGRLIILDKHIECKDCKYFSGGEPYDGNRHWCSKDAPDDSCEVDETDFCKEAEAKLAELKGE